MRSVKIAASLITLFLVLGLSLAIAYAQEPTVEPREEEPGGEINGLGLADPPPAGFSVLYMFTGVANNDAGDAPVATSVHCTNFGSGSVTLQIQFFEDNGAAAHSAYTDILSVHETSTYSTQPTLFREISLVGSGNAIEQGSGRVLAKEHSQVICTAQLLEPVVITPTFMVKLPLFDSNGNPVGGKGDRIFLPVILKQ